MRRGDTIGLVGPGTVGTGPGPLDFEFNSDLSAMVPDRWITYSLGIASPGYCMLTRPPSDRELLLYVHESFTEPFVVRKAGGSVTTERRREGREV